MTYDRNAADWAARCDKCSTFDGDGFAVDGPGECRVWTPFSDAEDVCDKCGRSVRAVERA